MRREYLAVGIRLALHPTADLATEPRWCRASGTFGEDAEVVARLVTAYIQGMQGETLGPHSVACMTKHFPGGGPQLDGEDPHFPYGREQVYPGDGFDYHLIPFEAAIGAGTAQIMPYYGMPVGTEYEEVGFGFNRGVITGLLRDRYGFDGVVCSDWGLITDAQIDGVRWPARAWGVEHLSREERVLKVIEAGVDQFGGEACPEIVVELVRSGRVDEERIDTSVRRLLRDKFRLGLFDDPYVDAREPPPTSSAGRTSWSADTRRRRARSCSSRTTDDVLPLRGSPKVYLEGLEVTDAAPGWERRRPTARTPTSQSCASRAPYEPRNGNFIESLFHAGDLGFDSRRDRLAARADAAGADGGRHLPRPCGRHPRDRRGAAALLADFGATDEALLDDRLRPRGTDGSAAVRAPVLDGERPPAAPRPAVRLEDPLFRFGHGLSYRDPSYAAGDRRP